MVSWTMRTARSLSSAGCWCPDPCLGVCCFGADMGYILPKNAVVRPGFPGVGLLESTMLLSHQDTGGQHGKTRLHRGVSSTGVGPCRGRTPRRGHRPRPGYQRPNRVRWRRQDRVDRGLESGLTTAERAELISARRRIRELETELAVHRRPAELLKDASTPKDSRQSR